MRGWRRWQWRAAQADLGNAHAAFVMGAAHPDAFELLNDPDAAMLLHDHAPALPEEMLAAGDPAFVPLPGVASSPSNVLYKSVLEELRDADVAAEVFRLPLARAGQASADAPQPNASAEVRARANALFERYFARSSRLERTLEGMQRWSHLNPASRGSQPSSTVRVYPGPRRARRDPGQ